MNSKKTLPIPNKPRFLTRTLRISNQHEAAYRIIYVKKFFIHKIIIPQKEDSDKTNYPLISRLFRNSKLLKSLKHAQISSHFKPGFHDNLKHSRNLKNYAFLFDHDYEEMSQISTYLKRISSQVQNIRLKIFRLTPIDHNNDLYDIAKCIRKFRKLENFYRAWDLDHESNYTFVPKELRLYSKSVSRLKEIKTMTCDLQLSEQAGLQRAMRRGVVYPGITGIAVDLRSNTFPNYEAMTQFFRGECIHDNEEPLQILDSDGLTREQRLGYQLTQIYVMQKDPGIDDDIGKYFNRINEETNIKNEIRNQLKEEGEDSFLRLQDRVQASATQDFVLQCRMREDIRPFYRFELFPNLKKLHFSQHSFLYPLGPFVIDGFKALKNLETLEIDIPRRSMGTNYIFKGLLGLPLLKKLSLYISFLKESDWALLQEFLKGQNDLQSFDFVVGFSPPTRARYLKQNAFLEETIQCLNNKPLLTSLELESRYWSLEALSKGLSHLKMINQLKILSLEGSDDTITCDRKLWKRVEGLCKFIKNQKESLKELRILLPMALDGELLTHISEAISKLRSLQKLEIEMNFPFDLGKRDMIEYFQDTLQAEIPPEQKKQLVIPEKWKINVVKYFKRLENLESFTLWMVPFHPEKKNSLKWFVEIVKVLSTLVRLRSLRVAISGGDSLKNDEKSIVNALLGLENIQEIIFDISNNLHEILPITRKVYETIKEVHQRQATKSHLMF